MLVDERRKDPGHRGAEAGPEPNPGNPTGADGRVAPRIYYVPFGVLAEADDWKRTLERAALLGFTLIGLPRPTAAGRDPSSAETAALLAERTAAAQTAGLSVMLDFALGAFGDEERALADLARYGRIGIDHFRCLDPERRAAQDWRGILGGVDGVTPRAAFYAWTPGVPWASVAEMAEAGFAGAFSSIAWWDERSAWIVEESRLLGRIGAVIGFPEAPDGERRAASAAKTGVDREVAARRALTLAAATSSGLLVPMGFERGAERRLSPRAGYREALEGSIDLDAEVAEANRLVAALAGHDGALRALTPPGASPTALLRTDTADPSRAERAAVVILDAAGAERPVEHLIAPVPATAQTALRVDPADAEALAPLAPGEIRIVTVESTAAVTAQEAGPADAGAERPRVAVERITPSVDDGRFPAKVIAGAPVVVEADLVADGHDRLAAELLWRAADETEWRRVPMHLVVNDRWRARFVPERIGRHVFAVEAWVDGFASFHHGLEAKVAAGRDVALEVEEGRLMLAAAAARPVAAAAAVGSVLARLGAAEGTAARAAVLLDATTVEVMAAAEERFFAARGPELPLTVDRPKALFASWYELFPRSATDDPERHGTFLDVVPRLPAIAAMGFDVLYFPPIHPIGAKNRKGRNNSLTPGPDDVGSPYAIGSAEGGHDALHPALGTIEDFRTLRDAAAAAGLELAIDFAIQCSPDHPWLTEHPEWFRHRPDGTIAYAENPPKRYEDIVNVDFYAEGAIPELWEALRDVVLFWAGEGVRIFRVDNPHTKPLPFWEWMIAAVQDRYPDAIFLAEAFTKPKMMNRLAKVGYTQSYTYFTWRNTKSEIEDYLTELTTTEAKDFFRPNFFVNTPDINPVFLQRSGRPGFLIRAALATTLSGSWGMYSGFEICENAALPGREEYLDSEKYEIRVRDYSAPGNIVAEITLLNRLRRTYPALQSHLGVTFYAVPDEGIILYGKRVADAEDMVLVAVCLDPHQPRETAFELPLWEWTLPDDGALAAEDLVTGHRFIWRGKQQHLRLDPAVLPYALWHLTPISGETPS